MWATWEGGGKNGMRSRSLGNQRAEVRLACKILNTMKGLGRPDSVKVE
jgi:hypothetical protein